MANYFEITFGDLSYDKQQDLIESVAKNLLEFWKEEESKNHVLVTGLTWEERFMRSEGIKEEDWQEDENYDFKYWLEDYAEQEAEKKLIQGFRHLEVEIEL